MLVLEDPQGEPTQQQKAMPDLLGMNIIGCCYRLLFEQFGHSLYQSTVLQAASKEWKKTRFTCQRIEASSTQGYLGKAKVHGRAIHVPAGSVKWILLPTSPSPQYCLNP